MFPVALDLTRISILLIGQGPCFAKRQKVLEEEGASHFAVCHPNEAADPRDSLDAWLGADASRRWHESTIIMMAGLPYDIAKAVMEKAHAAGKLVNVEDINDLCDFYFTANVRRGDLVIAVSTSGASPTLARKVRDAISERFGPEWTGHVQEMARLRKALKARGASMQEVMESTERTLLEKGWLADKKEAV